MSPDCPSSADYQQLLLGRKSRPEAERLAQHVEHCSTCGEIVEQFLAQDTMLEALRTTADGAAAPVTDVIERLKTRLRPLRSHSESSQAIREPVSKELHDFLSPAQGLDELGRLGPYRILQVLGAGGMGVVFEAEDTQLQRRVALKAMKPVLAASESARQRFLREARAAAAIEHDHIVTIYQVGEDRGLPFLAMQLLQGQTLAEHLGREKRGELPAPLPVGGILRIGLQIAKGLAVAHERGLIHRDIKPANIWLEAGSGRVKILDFGLARAVGDDEQLTQQGAIVGTPQFMAPEQARGETVDPRCDLFSLGCVLYEMSTGRSPFQRASTGHVLMALEGENPQSPRQVNPHVPPSLASLILRLLAKDRADRHASAALVAKELEAIEQDWTNACKESALPPTIITPSDPAQSAQTSGVAPAPATSKRRRLLLGAAALLAVCILTAVIIKRSEQTVPVNAQAMPVDAEWIKKVASLPAEKQAEMVGAKLKELNPGFDGKIELKAGEGNQQSLDLGGKPISDISPIAVFKDLRVLNLWGTKVADLSSLKGLPLRELGLWGTNVTDLSPLKGMPLQELGMGRTRVTDLSPLQGMPLEKLFIAETQVTDLTPLKSLPLQVLHFPHTAVSDLSPLRGMGLNTLNCSHTPIKDLSALKGMSLVQLDCRGTAVTDFSVLKTLAHLESLLCDFKSERDTELLRSLKTLRKVNGKPVPTLWRNEEWIKTVAGLPADKQAAMVSAKLKELNPDFDGKIELKSGEDSQLSLDLSGKPISDISPIAVFKALRVLNLGGTKVADLSPLTGIPLRELGIWDTKVTDLSPLQGMPLETLYLGKFFATSQVSDLNPLKGMRLTYLNASRTKVSDLAPLQGMPIKSLNVGGTQVTDLSPLEGMPLESLRFPDTKVSDLKALRGLPLKHLSLDGTKIADLAPLQGMPLVELTVQRTEVADLIPLQGMKLKTLTIGVTKVTDLTPLQGMPLVKLHCADTAIADLTPLRGMPLFELECRNIRAQDLSVLKDLKTLERLKCDFKPERDAALLRSLKGLKSINGEPAAEFWKSLEDRVKADDEWIKTTAGLPASKQVEMVGDKLKELNPGFDGKLISRIEEGKVTYLDLTAKPIAAIVPIAVFKDLRILYLKETQVSDLSPLKGLPLRELGIGRTRVFDLFPLQGMPLEKLWLPETEVADLAPLQGSPLQILHISGTKVSDLTPLKGMRLDVLNFSHTPVKDLAPLQGMPLLQLYCSKTQVTDFSVLRTLDRLEMLRCDFRPERDTETLRSIKSLRRINGKKAADFWGDEEWVKTVAGLSAEKQAEMVGAKLKELNSEFDGKLAAKIEGGKIISLDLGEKPVANIAPLAALKDLQALSLRETKAADLAPLKGLPLRELGIGQTAVVDLTPLQGMPLESLWLLDTRVTDLTPLQGLPLKTLHVGRTKVTDLTPLRGLPLVKLECYKTGVTDLSPLKGMPLRYLAFDNTKVKDLSPLKDLPVLEELKYDFAKFAQERDREVLRSIKTLKTINQVPVADFWKQVKPPEIEPKLATTKPVEEEWLRLVAGQPASKQAEMVATKLKERNPGFDGKMETVIAAGHISSLNLKQKSVVDIAPLAAWKKLKTLRISNTRVADLTPLRGMALETLNCSNTQVKDLMPLKGMPLHYLDCSQTKVVDLSVLRNMPLRQLKCDFKPERDMENLRPIKTLERINGETIVEFWKKHVPANKP